jgi:hypothetical protein
MIMSAEFQYRLPHRIGGWRPGSHASVRLGAGQDFVTHMSLFEAPDPRRLDLRASLRNVREEWLVRANRQRSALAVHAIVDVSASMDFGAHRNKRLAASDFVESMGNSAFRAGDAVGMLAFDAVERTDLFVPCRLGRGAGNAMAELLRAANGVPGSGSGLVQAALHLTGRPELVFVVSDFHWPLQSLDEALELLASSCVVPVVVWDAAELRPPAGDGPVLARDAESGATRMIWLRPSLRAKWAERVANRRRELEEVFAKHRCRPFYLSGAFDHEAMSRYFIEETA